MSVYKINKIDSLIKDNPYVGRGIILGKSSDGTKAIAVYFIMGRSENSRNRVFVETGDDVMIKAFDEAKLSDPSLIIYYPLRKLDNTLIVTNGDQTDTVYKGIKEGKSFAEALKSRRFEPDMPNLTPRISGIIQYKTADADNMTGGEMSYELSILKSGDESGTVCNRYTFSYEAINGLGHFIHTYQGDGNPLPTFVGEPDRVELSGSLEAFVENVWSNLNEENKISILGKSIDLSTGEVETIVINKNK
ncbi:MAG: IMP cyclohydrolase [Peptostreptococcaceae bacterium]|nr:IMP cyclohydrolase [Peptostreptococcaceae bacterium]MDY5738936.1 IMP cyclohydrolase [Anaerovoracaceae bacterium]